MKYFNKNIFYIQRERVKRFLFLSILFIGIILRLYKWNGYSLWHDEVNWLMVWQGRLLVSLKDTVAILKPPLFRFLIYFWTYFARDEFTLRLLPFILGVLSILFIYKVAKLLFDEKIGLIAAFLLAFSPFHIYYSQELTHYTLATFLCLCSVYYLFCSLKGNNIYSWIKFIIFTALLLYSHYPSLFFLITMNIFFLFSYAAYKRLLKRWIVSQIIIILLYLPWLMIIPKQFIALSFYSDYVKWIPRGSFSYLFQTLRIFNVGYNANGIIQFFASPFFFLLLAIGLLSNFRKNKQEIKLLTLWLFAPMILSILFSAIANNFTYRNLIFILPAYYILISTGIAKLKMYAYIPIIFSMLLSALSLFNYYRNIFPYPHDFYRPGVHAKKDIRAAAKYIIANFKEGDIVVHTNSSTILPYVYYLYSLTHNHVNGLRNFLCDLINAPENEENLFYDWDSRFLLNRQDKLIRFFNNDNKRIWLIFSEWEPQLIELPPFGEEYKVRKWLNDNLRILVHKRFTGVDVYLYDKSNI